jgi:preprotein translocase subunit SecE
MSKIIQFIKEVKAEFKNITWPKKDTLIQLTIVVISISVIISLILGGFDFLFINSFKFLTKIRNQSSTPSQNIEKVSETENIEIQEQTQEKEPDKTQEEIELNIQKE